MRKGSAKGGKMEEQSYYQDESVNVTDHRVACGYVTVPLERINEVAVTFKAFTWATAFVLLLLALVAVPAACYFYGGCGYFGIILPLIALFWFWRVCRTYVEIKISTSTGMVRLLTAGMGELEYVFKIEEVLKKAVTDRRKT